VTAGRRRDDRDARGRAMTGAAGAITPVNARRLLAGPPFHAGAESWDEHLRRLGRWSNHAVPYLVPTLEASGLLGRGGAGFPVGRKWRSVADRSAGADAKVLVNGAEGEPRSRKDQALMALRPHLVLDGAHLAAAAVGASEVVVYVGSAHARARRAIERAVAERPAQRDVEIRLVVAPDRYVAGEESAAIHLVEAGDARPTVTPPRPYERGIAGRPTIVQNVESLAYAALIARRGDAWYRELGRAGTPGTTLVTVSGLGEGHSVHEVELGLTIGELAAGIDMPSPDGVRAVLVGGYFGGWLDAGAAWDLPIDPAALRAAGSALGAGVISFLPAGTCPVVATARIADYMAGQSAAQCGPCVYGLRAIADATIRIARSAPDGDELARLERWAGQVRDRGACRHPDGAVGLLVSALETFGDEFRAHQVLRRCASGERRPQLEQTA